MEESHNYLYLLQYYTNNYRPIYHLEKYIYKLTQIVNTKKN